MLSRSAILPSPTREVGRNQGPVPPEGIEFAMRKALGAIRLPYGPCFDPEEEPDPDSPSRKASSSTNWEMILKEVLPMG